LELILDRKQQRRFCHALYMETVNSNDTLSLLSDRFQLALNTRIASYQAASTQSQLKTSKAVITSPTHLHCD